MNNPELEGYSFQDIEDLYSKQALICFSDEARQSEEAWKKEYIEMLQEPLVDRVMRQNPNSGGAIVFPFVGDRHVVLSLPTAFVVSLIFALFVEVKIGDIESQVCVLKKDLIYDRTGWKWDIVQEEINALHFTGRYWDILETEQYAMIVETVI